MCITARIGCCFFKPNRVISFVASLLNNVHIISNCVHFPVILASWLGIAQNYFSIILGIVGTGGHCEAEYCA